MKTTVKAGEEGDEGSWKVQAARRWRYASGGGGASAQRRQAQPRTAPDASVGLPSARATPGRRGCAARRRANTGVPWNPSPPPPCQPSGVAEICSLLMPISILLPCLVPSRRL